MVITMRTPLKKEAYSQLGLGETLLNVDDREELTKTAECSLESYAWRADEL